MPDADDDEGWMPLDSINWLIKMSLRGKIGSNNYARTIKTIRQLLHDRAELQIKLDKLEKELARLQVKPIKSEFGIEGQGSWGQ